METQWHTWINSNMLTNSDAEDGEFLSVKDYFSYIFKSIIIPKIRNKKIIMIYDDINNMTERALNVYFWMWIAFNKSKNHPYLWKSHSLNSIYEPRNLDILEYLDLKLFPDEFWNNIKNTCAFGHFSPNLSDFGRIFWETLPGFMLGHINLEHSSGLSHFFNSGIGVGAGAGAGAAAGIEKSESIIRVDVDPYVSDYINNNQYP